MDLRQLVQLALQISIAATVLGFGLNATMDDLLYLLRRPGLLARSLVAMLVIMPIVAVLLARMFGFLPMIEIALIALAISPVPPLLPGREGKAGGHASYGLGLMATLGALSIALVPLAVELLGHVFGRPFALAPSVIAGMMLTMVLVPLLAGVAVRSFAPALADRIRGAVNALANVLLTLAVLPLLIVAAPAIWQLIGDGTLLAILVFVLAGLAVGHLLGGPEPDRSSVLALSTACRHPAIALAIAAANFPEERFGGAILLYLIVNLIVSVPYITWQRKRMSAATTAA